MADAKPNKRRRILVVLRTAVVVVGVIAGAVWLSKEGRWANLKAIFAQMNMWVFCGAFGIFCLSQIMVGLRWWLLLRTQGIFISFWMAVRLYLLGWFYNNVMPGSVGGDLIRLWYVTKHTDKKFEAGLSVVVDRVIGLVSTLIIAAFFYVVFLRAEGQKVDFTTRGGLLASLSRFRWLLLWVAVIVAAVVGGLLAHVRGRAFVWALWCGGATHGAALVKRLANAMLLYGTKPLVLLTAFGLTIVLQIINITGFWLLGRNLGIEASVKYYYVFFTLVWVLGMIPVSIGGVFVMEVILASLFVKFAGVDATAAAALALCQRFVWIIGSLPGAVIHLFGAHLPKNFSVDCDNSVK